MAQRKLSTIQYHPMIQGVSRAFKTGTEKCTETLVTRGSGSYYHIPGTPYMGAQIRNTHIVGVGAVQKNVMFFRKPIARQDATQDQNLVKSAFTYAAQWTDAAMKDLTAVGVNGARWREAVSDLNKKIDGISAKGYQGIRGWMRAIAFNKKYYDHENMPANHQLPEFDA